jgi:hypothetical protein
MESVGFLYGAFLECRERGVKTRIGGSFENINDLSLGEIILKEFFCS